MFKYLLTFLLVTCMAVSAMSFEAATTGGVGLVLQKGGQSDFAYYVGFGIPIVQKSDAGFLLKTETTYLYSDREMNEFQVIRILAVVEKSLMTKVKKLANGTESEYFKWYVGFGSGSWTFTRSSEESAENDEMFGAFNFRTGVDYQNMFVMVSGDVVQVPGNELFGVFLGFGFDF